MKNNKKKYIVIFSTIGVVLAMLITALCIYLSMNKTSIKFDKDEKLFINSQVILYNESLENNYVPTDVNSDSQRIIADINSHIKSVEELLISYDFKYRILESNDYSKAYTISYYGINNDKIKYDIFYNETQNGIEGKIKMESLPEYSFVCEKNEKYESTLNISNDVSYYCEADDPRVFSVYKVIGKNKSKIYTLDRTKDFQLKTTFTDYTCVVVNSRLQFNIKYADTELVLSVGIDQLEGNYVYKFSNENTVYKCKR